ncbi:sodium:solute symporter family transporter [Chitinophaga caseinilytica]|uniref:sodium:solute symporter family transporter n=1 Tax=Chitinophaga caseinilytica TaxID=2267521 RepID=UPI003C2ED248
MRFIRDIRFMLTASLFFSWINKGSAQQPNHIRWDVAAKLPELPDGAPQPGVAGAFTGVHNNVLLLAGGANFPDAKPWAGGTKTYRNEVYVLRGDTVSTFPLGRSVAYGASATVPAGVVCIGGENAGGPLAQAFLLQWQGRVVVKDLPSLPFPLTNASATAIGSTVFVAGGENSERVSDAFLSIDLSSAAPAWKRLSPIPKPLSHSVLVAQSNGSKTQLFLIGGRARTDSGISELSSAAWRYDPGSDGWSAIAPIHDEKGITHLSAATAVATGASYILVAGGDKGNIFHRIETLNAQIARATGEAKAELTEEKLRILNNHPGFNTDILLYNTITDTWTVAGQLPYLAPVTATAVKWNGDIYIPSGEVRPGTRTIDVLRGSISKPSFFSTTDYIVLALYFIGMVIIGLWTSRHQHSTADYFKGGEKIPGWATGLSIFGAKLSAITFIGIPAKTYATDWTYFFLLMTIICCMPFVVRFFIPYYRRLGVTSSYEYLEKRFSYAVRSVSAGMYILLQLGRMGIVILLPAIALSVVTGIDVKLSILLMGAVSLFYTVLGGIEAVIWTEVVQVIILLAGALLALVLIPMSLTSDGAAVSRTLAQYDKLKLFDFRFDFSSATFWVVIIGGFTLNLIQYGCDQTVVQRYLTTPDEKTAVRSLKLGAWLTLPSTIIFFAIGTLLFLFYRDHPGQVNMALDAQDTIFPWYIVTQLPAGVAGLVITAIFAAAMGSLNGSLNGVSTVFVNDFLRRLQPGKGDKFYLRSAKLTTLLVGLAGTGIAWSMAEHGATSLWDQFNLILGLFTGGVGGLFVLGIFTRRATDAGAVAGFVASAAIQVVLLQFTDMHLLMYAFTGLASCVIAGYGWSVLFPKTQNISGLTIYR